MNRTFLIDCRASGTVCPREDQPGVLEAFNRVQQLRFVDVLIGLRPSAAPRLVARDAVLDLMVDPTSMSSREIADLTGKDHFNVLIDVRKMLQALELDVLSFQAMSPDAYGRPQPVFNLPKDLTLTLISGYSVPMRHRIVTRWQELEELPSVLS